MLALLLVLLLPDTNATPER